MGYRNGVITNLISIRRAVDVAMEKTLRAGETMPWSAYVGKVEDYPDDYRLVRNLNRERPDHERLEEELVAIIHNASQALAEIHNAFPGRWNRDDGDDAFTGRWNRERAAGVEDDGDGN